MKIWIVCENTDDSADVGAAYATEELANAHIAELGGWVTETDVRDALHPDVTDPAKLAEREREKEMGRKRYEEYMRNLKESEDRAAAIRPNPPHMSLCHCQTFSTSSFFINAHGHCGYCGGFTPTVFRAHMGDGALHAEIDKLDIYDREKMRELVANPVL